MRDSPRKSKAQFVLTYFFMWCGGQKDWDNLSFHQGTNCIYWHALICSNFPWNHMQLQCGKKSIRSPLIWFALMIICTPIQLSIQHSEDVELTSNHKHNDLFFLSHCLCQWTAKWIFQINQYSGETTSYSLFGISQTKLMINFTGSSSSCLHDQTTICSLSIISGKSLDLVQHSGVHIVAMDCTEEK